MALKNQKDRRKIAAIYSQIILRCSQWRGQPMGYTPAR